MLLVLLDTNILFDDFFFEGRYLNVLLDNREEYNFNVGILEFVKREIIKKYKDSISEPLNKSLKSLMKSNDKFRLGLQLPDSHNYKSLKKNIGPEYERKLQEILDEKNIILVEFLPNDSGIANISNRYFDKRKPFDENKISFQDAIIVEELLLLAKTNEYDTIYFISKNIKDFASENGELHEDIIGNEDFRTDIKFFSDTSKFMNHIFELEDVRYEEEFDLFKLKVENEDFLGSLSSNEGLQEYIVDKLENYMLDFGFEGEYIYGGWASDIYLDELIIDGSEVTSIDVQSGKAYVNLYGEVNLSFDLVGKNPMYEQEYDDSSEEYLTEYSKNKNVSLTIKTTINLQNESEIEYNDIEFNG